MTIHIYPLNDRLPHDTEQQASECQCLCEPRIEWIGDDLQPLEEPIVVHNSFDGRELKEADKQNKYLFCDHEFVEQDHSFDHEFGTEVILYDQCVLCGLIR